MIDVNTILNYLVYVLYGINGFLLLKLIQARAIPYISRKRNPKIIDRIEEGDSVMVDTRKINWRRSLNSMVSKERKNDLSEYETFRVDSISKYHSLEDDVYLEKEIEGEIWRIHLEGEEEADAIEYIYEEECSKCNSETVYSKERDKFVCPFCEI